MSNNACEIKGCSGRATRIANAEGKHIMICDKCWHDIYKK